jgi:hypothetical protein
LKLLELLPVLLAAFPALACSSVEHCGSDWQVGEKLEMTVVANSWSEPRCSEELGLEDGAMLTAIVRDFQGGGYKCVSALADFTTATGEWKPTAPTGGPISYDISGDYAVTSKNCEFTGDIMLLGEAHGQAELNVRLYGSGDGPNCGLSLCSGEWIVRGPRL